MCVRTKQLSIGINCDSDGMNTCDALFDFFLVK